MIAIQCPPFLQSLCYRTESNSIEPNRAKWNVRLCSITRTINRTQSHDWVGLLSIWFNWLRREKLQVCFWKIDQIFRIQNRWIQDVSSSQVGLLNLKFQSSVYWPQIGKKHFNSGEFDIHPSYDLRNLSEQLLSFSFPAVVKVCTNLQ